uniref:Uncharacterized protein n=1 Tax=Zea mays TaxID=4577 RepID=A0A804R3A3_MAIZE
MPSSYEYVHQSPPNSSSMYGCCRRSALRHGQRGRHRNPRHRWGQHCGGWWRQHAQSARKEDDVCAVHLLLNGGD